MMNIGIAVCIVCIIIVAVCFVVFGMISTKGTEDCEVFGMMISPDILTVMFVVGSIGLFTIATSFGIMVVGDYNLVSKTSP